MSLSDKYASVDGTDVEKRSSLKRMKTVATLLLVVAGLVFVAATWFSKDMPWLEYVAATAEAAMVGALADWFAVTALFKHPLGIPIPHTAIIQKRKEQIGASLGSFVRDNFLTAQVLELQLNQADLAARIGDWLAQPKNARTVGVQSAAVIGGVTQLLQDEAIQQGVESAVMGRMEKVKAAPLVGRAVDAAMEGDHHQVLIENVLSGLGVFMEDNKSTFRERLNSESPWWVPGPIDDVLFDKIYTAVRKFLTEVSSDRDHAMRLDIDVRAKRLAAELKGSPEMLRRGEELKSEILNHPEVRAWSASLWERIKLGLVDAADDPQSELRIRLEKSICDMGEALKADAELRAKLDKWIVEVVAYVAEQFRDETVALISSTVNNWDDRETAERLELQVGRDLQFIRINGTLVGGVAGLTIHTLSKLIL